LKKQAAGTMAFLTYISTALRVYREIKTQKNYNQSFLIPYLQELENKHGGQFAPEQKNKILNYYGLFITSFLCSTYKRLYNKVLTDEERKRATLFGVLTPVGDDLFDEDKLNIDDIRRITYTPEAYNATTFSGKVAKEIQTYLLASVPHKKEYLEASKNVVEIQVETIKQAKPGLSKEETERITYTKGAVSVIIYHQCLDDAATHQMLETLFYIGSLYQLGNDIFDLYKDVRDNIYTLVNTCGSFSDFRGRFMERVRAQNRRIMALPYKHRNKKEFCIIINTINARSLVALDQFVRQQKKLGGKKINWWQLQRKDMIVDMEKKRNILRWLQYVFTIPNWR
jgi:hypothetical protein